VARHAKEVHGVDQVPPEVISKVKDVMRDE